MAKSKSKKKKPVAPRVSPARVLSVREELRALGQACDIATQQLRDDVLIREVEKALEVISETVEKYGQIWLCGNGVGFTLAVETAHKLSTPSSNFERSTRAIVLGLNVAIATTSYGKCGTDEALAAELMINGRRGDVVWCFASDPSSQALLTLANTAHNKLKIPVIVFTIYPGTPLVKFCDAKVRIQQTEDVRDQSGYCVEWAHTLLANIMCSQIKRMARRMRL